MFYLVEIVLWRLSLCLIFQFNKYLSEPNSLKHAELWLLAGRVHRETGASSIAKRRV